MVNGLLNATDRDIEQLSHKQCIDYAKYVTRSFLAYAHATDECIISQDTRSKITRLAHDLLATREKISQ